MEMNSWTGDLRLICAKKAGKTMVQEVYFEGALKITRPVYLDESGKAYIYVMNPGGGYVDGDTYRMQIQLEAGAEVLLTTQSSTKIYKTPETPVLQTMDIVLKQGSVFEYVPDPVIAYPQARFKQKLAVQMERGASFVCSDIYTPGWAPDGSPFRYESIQSRMDIYQDQQLIVYDHLKLQPKEDLGALGSLDGYTHLGSMIMIDEAIDQEGVDQLQEMMPAGRIGLSLLMVPGMSIRMLAHRTQDIEMCFSICHRWLCERKFREYVALRK